jgi:ribosomal protein S27AE
MAKKDVSKKSVSYTIDLTKIEGDGSFPCPKCGTVMSPEDETEEIYKIVHTKVINDELVELIVMCRNCGSNIKLTGFQQIIEGLASK